MPYGDAMNETERANEGAVEAAATAHIAEVMNHGWLCMLLSLGERLDLHTTLAATGGGTVDELAAVASCDPRYLEEWLWGMAAGGILTVSAADDPVFSMRPEYIPVLTASGGPLHWSRITTQITALATLESSLVEAFTTGTGIGAEAYEGRIAEVLAGESGPIFERVLLNEVLPMSGRFAALEEGIRVADIGCGTGTAALIIGRRFPTSRVVGVDQSQSALDIAAARCAAEGLTNVTFQLADVEDDLNIGEQDLVLAANVVHDLSSPEAFFERVRSTLAPGGLFYLHELSATREMTSNITDTHALGILTFSLYHCVPLAKRRPGIAPGGMWGRERYIEALDDAGFEAITIVRAPSDPNNDTIFATAPGRDSN